MKKKLFTLIMMLISFSIQIIAQMRDYTAMVVDAETGEALHYASVYIAENRGTITNQDGKFLISASPEEILQIKFIGYENLRIKASEMLDVIRLKPAAQTMKQISVFPIMAMLKQITKNLNTEYKKFKKEEDVYFFRITTDVGGKKELAEAFMTARSAVNLRDISLLCARRGQQDGDSLANPLLSNANFHLPLELGALTRDVYFWKILNTPIREKFDEKYFNDYYNISVREIISEDGDSIFCLKFEPNKDLTSEIRLVGELYVDAKNLDLLRFKGKIPSMAMEIINGKVNRTISVDITVNADYTRENGFSKVANISASIRNERFNNHALLYRMDSLSIATKRRKKVKDNLLSTIDQVGDDSPLWVDPNIVLRTAEEESIASQQEIRKDTLSLDSVPGTMKPIIERLTAFSQRIPQEKVFIHMDNSCYFLGDTIWFSAYTRETATGKPSPLSRVLYVELLNHDGYLVERKLIELNKGRGDGFFALDKNIQYSGFHELRAYTRWQLNWGCFEHKHSLSAKRWFVNEKMEKLYYRDYEKLYSRVFPVYDKPKEEGSLARNMTLRPMRRYFAKDMDKRELTLNLFPEGGNLVAGIPNRMAFEATWDDGEWLEGWLHFGTDSFPTVHRGRGVITLTPQKDMEKEVAFITKDGEKVKAKLPEIKEEGAAMQVEQKDGTVEIGIRLSASMQPDSMAMTVMHEGKVKAFFTMEGKEETFRIDSEDLQAGVHQATLFDTQGRVYADRLFFVRRTETERPTLTFTAPKDECKPYEKISLEINGAEGNTPISLAVRDGLNSPSLYDNGNIMTEMLLASEIKGFIPEPGWYFEKDDEQHRQALDLLMMTQGWRRFDWKDMAVKGKWDIKHQPEQTPYIEGSIETEEDLPIINFIEKKILARSKSDTKNRIEASDIRQGHPESMTAQSGLKEQTENENKTAQIGLNEQTGNGNEEQEQDEDNTYQREKRNNKWEEKIKGGVRIHGELIHAENHEPAVCETDAKGNYFMMKLPHFYGHSRFFLAASDTTKWEKGKQKLWVQMMEKEADLPETGKRKFRVDDAEFLIRIWHPYPRFTKPYTFYQKNVATKKKTNNKGREVLEDGTEIMAEATVNARHGGLRSFNDAFPAFMLDAYDAMNETIDAGMDFSDNPIVRTYIGDLGLDSPFAHEDANNSVSNSIAKSGRIRLRFGLSHVRRRLPQYRDIPIDSIYSPKYLKALLIPPSQLSPEEWYAYETLFEHEKYAIYTDYHPRLEGNERYYGADLPETNFVIYPYPDGGQRVVYRDRHYILPGFAYSAECYSPDYSKQTPPDSVKDYRRTLYWNPNLMLDKDGKATVILYNNARTTQISVDAAGQAADGTLLWGSER